MNAARTLLLILVTLSVLTLLAQGLSWTEIIQNSGQPISVYLKIVFLGTPQVFTLLVPIAMFIACTWSLNTVHRDGEIVVVQATGMTNWQVASPLLRLAMILAILHLATVLWVQPTAQRELRETLYQVRTDLGTSLIRPGEFTTDGASLTFYAREHIRGVLHGLIITDASDPNSSVQYFAREGRITKVNGQPTIIMTDTQIHERASGGGLSVIEFDQYTYDLSPFVKEDTDAVLEASDRYLPELLNIDQTSYVETQLQGEFTAEFHNRLSSPILNFVMALLAIWGILGGDYSKTGYQRRIAKTSAIAITVFISHLLANASAVNAPAYNTLQWVIPFGAVSLVSIMYFTRIGRIPRALRRSFARQLSATGQEA